MGKSPAEMVWTLFCFMMFYKMGHIRNNTGCGRQQIHPCRNYGKRHGIRFHPLLGWSVIRESQDRAFLRHARWFGCDDQSTS